MVVDRRTYDTPHGPGRIVQRRADSPWAALVLTHSAGSGIEAHDLVALAARLPTLGINVALVELPWRTAGKRIAAAPSVLDASFRSLANHLRPRTPMFVGGRSTGARVACRTARGLGAIGVLALAFPLHPPGRSDASRVAELRGARLPTLVVQGERDAHGTPAEFPADTNLVRIAEADHSFAVGARAGVSQQATTQAVVDAAYTWIAGSLGRGTTAHGTRL